jgi:methylglyoxal synthase
MKAASSAAHAARSTDAALCASRCAQLRIAPVALRTTPQRLSRNSGAAPLRRASSAAKKTSTTPAGGDSLVVASLADPHAERHIHVYAPLAPPPEETDIELGRFVANVRSPRFGC